MQRLIPVLLLLSFNSHAGIETRLLQEKYASCTIRISHDALATAKTGSLVFKSFILLNDVHQPCAPSRQHIHDSLDRALTSFGQQKLKPLTSLFIGRLIHYPWIRDDLARQAPLPKTLPPHKRTELFKSGAFISQNLSPFQRALAGHHYKISNMACEKLLLDKQGRIEDALCWIIVEDSLSK